MNYNTTHPEIQEGEKFLGNVDKEGFRNRQQGEQIMYNHKHEFSRKLETYMNAKAFTATEKTQYIKKLLHDKEYSQKLMYMKANNRVIEIELLREMLENVK